MGLYARRKGWQRLALLAVSVLVLGWSNQVVAKTVFIEAIGGFDATLVNEARPYLAAWIEGTGHQLSTVKDTAEYRVRFTVTEAKATRPFNWWILVVPFWPFVPATTVEAEVVVSLTIQDSTGREVYANTAGGEASAWLCGDFFSRKWAKREAFAEAFKRVVVSAYLP